MKKISDQLKKSISAEVSYLAVCYTLELVDGTVLGFTDHPEDLNIDNITYKTNAGFESSAIESTASLSVDNLEVSGFLNSHSIRRRDILLGRYDYAKVDIFVVDYTKTSSGKINLKSGYFGEIILSDNQFCVEIRGMSDMLSNKSICQLYSPTCRAEFGGDECKIDKRQYSYKGKITKILARTIFISKNLNISDYLYCKGEIQFLTGRNANITRSIREAKKDTLTCSTEFPMPISIGDKFVIFIGCDKKISTCCKKYNNVINFRGEPHLPGIEEMSISLM